MEYITGSREEKNGEVDVRVGNRNKRNRTRPEEIDRWRKYKLEIEKQRDDCEKRRR